MSRGLSVIVLAGLLWAGAAQALPSYPVPLYMPEPDYPASMRHTLVKKQCHRQDFHSGRWRRCRALSLNAVKIQCVGTWIICRRM